MTDNQFHLIGFPTVVVCTNTQFSSTITIGFYYPSPDTFFFFFVFVIVSLNISFPSISDSVVNISKTDIDPNG